jgi:hypothetical protein
MNRHSLNDLASYIVTQTIVEGEVRLPGTDVAHVATYVEALDVARGVRQVRGSWAVIFPVYTDGTRGRDPF